MTNRQGTVVKPPLDGVRILELGMVFVLPLAITPLAALGADVIKVETAERPDSVRWGPQPDNRLRPDGYNHGAHFQMLNRNKRGISLNLAHPEGREIFLKLVAVSDVVAENFTPRVMKNLRLTYDELRSVNPSIILLSSTGFGQDGPWRDYRAYGPNTEAVDGLMHLTGYPDGPPVRAGAGGMGVAFTDVSGALYGTFAILAALERRQRTGEGTWLDLSHYEAGVATIPEAIIDFSMNGRIQSRNGNRDPQRVPQGCYQCAGVDRWVSISVHSDAAFRELATALGQPALAEEPRFATARLRSENHDELDRIIETWTRPLRSADVERLLQKVGVEAMAVATPRDVWFDEQLRHRGFFEAVPAPLDAPDVGVRPHIRPVWKSGMPRVETKRAPKFGEHNREVFGELLGISEQEQDRLSSIGVIASAPTPGRLARPGTMDLDALVTSGRLREADPDYQGSLESHLLLTISQDVGNDAAMRYRPSKGQP